jgi:hypothetical protein
MPRFEIELGLELYNTKCLFAPGKKFVDLEINGMTYPKSYLTKLRDRLLSAIHLHSEIYNLVYFVNSLVKLAELTGTKLFFINGLCPWDNNYFTQLHDVTPNQYTKFTQELLSVNNRDDEEIFALYFKMHTEYNNAGNIQPTYWINLYNSFRSMQVDLNSDNNHPGLESNKIFSDLINSHLCSIL